jgi:hypothetical protein
MKHPSEFRQWTTKMWHEHVKEILSITGRPATYTAREYFARNKYFLKKVWHEEKVNA